MLSELKIVNPLDIQNWDELIRQHPDYSSFHSLQWARLISETYDYIPYYFVIKRDEKFLAMVSLMIIKSFLTSNRAVSLPFTDYCEPLMSEEIDFNQILKEIISSSKKQNLNTLNSSLKNLF